MTIVSKRRLAPSKDFRAAVWHQLQRSSVFLGCAVVLVVVLVGRSWLPITSKTLAGWTALFLLAIFIGLIVANLRSQSAWGTPLQTFGMFSGAFASAITLALLYHLYTAAGEIMLGLTGLMLLISILSIKRHQPLAHKFHERSLATWALRLDDLLKYDLHRDHRFRLASLIDQLWRSPENVGNFIPAQNVEFEHLLDALESSVRTHDSTSLEQNLVTLSRCLDMRNQIIGKQLHVEFQKIEPNKLSLPDGSRRELTTASDRD